MCIGFKCKSRIDQTCKVIIHIEAGYGGSSHHLTPSNQCVNSCRHPEPSGEMWEKSMAKS